jgi:hypothetical protein
MKLKHSIIQISLFLFTSGASFCQQVHLAGELFQPDIPTDLTTFFNTDWLEGEILLSDSTVVRNVRIRYNGLLDELFWLEPESNKTIKLDREAILRFHFNIFNGDTSVYFRKLKVKRENFPDSVEIFGQELFEGKVSLYLRHSFYYAGSKSVQMNKRYVLKDNYQKEPVYYIYISDNKIFQFKRFSRKNIYTSFPDKKLQIKKYLNESLAGKLKTTSEIVSLIKYIDSLL